MRTIGALRPANMAVWEGILAAALGVCVAGSLALPRAAPVLWSLLALVALAAHVAIARSWEPLEGPQSPLAERLGLGPLAIALLVFAAYCLVTTAWSATPLNSAARVAWLAFVVVAAHAAAGLIARSGAARQRLLETVIVAYAMGAAFVLLEVMTNQSILKAALNAFPFLGAVSSKHSVVEAGELKSVGAYLLNRNLGALSLLLWPALLAIHLRDDGWPGRLAMATVGLVAGFAAAYSQHESSVLALIVGAVVFLLARLLPAAGRGLVAVGWLCAVLTVVPVALLLYKAELYQARFLPLSAQARIVFWNTTASKYFANPVLGVGAGSTKSIDDAMKPTAKKLPGHPIEQRTGQHAHNVYLQTWFETGAVGAALLLVAGLTLWRAIGRLHESIQPYALAGFSAAMVIGAFTWGLWQEWYLALFGLSGMLLAGLAGLKRAADDPT
jgi:O-antigen ligase